MTKPRRRGALRHALTVYYQRHAPEAVQKLDDRFIDFFLPQVRARSDGGVPCYSRPAVSHWCCRGSLWLCPYPISHAAFRPCIAPRPVPALE